MRCRNYIFTLFNVNPTTLLQKLENCAHLRYAIFQEEECPNTNRRHLQGYIEFTKAIRIPTIKHQFGRQIHLERRRGTRQEARDYCRKEETRVSGPYECGEWRTDQGKRNDLETIREKIKAGVSETEIADQHFGSWVRYRKSFTAYRELQFGRRDWKSSVTIYYGEPGVGKTRRVYDDHERASIYEVPRPNGGVVWWDGYQPHIHTTIILDDFYGWIPYTEMLRLMDRYPYRVPVKGGFTEFLAKNIYITSNVHWTQWYDFSKTHFNEDAFKRRIDKIEIMRRLEDLF